MSTHSRTLKTYLNKAHMPSISVIKYNFITEYNIIFFLSSPRCGWRYSDLMRSGCLFSFPLFHSCAALKDILSALFLTRAPGGRNTLPTDAGCYNLREKDSRDVYDKPHLIKLTSDFFLAVLHTEILCHFHIQYNFPYLASPKLAPQ